MKHILNSLALFSVCAISYAQAPGIEWQKSYGGGFDDYLESVEQTSDGGYVAAGFTMSNEGDVSGNHGNQVGGYGYEEVWVVKVDAFGALQWQKALGGMGDDRGHCVWPTSDGGYIVAGETSSNNDGDVTGKHGLSDCWIIKLNSQGIIEWQKCYGGSGNDIAYAIRQTADGGYVFAGQSNIADGDVTSNQGLQDFWIVKTDANGTIEWQKSRGGSGTDYAQSVQQTNDHGYIIAGCTFSTGFGGSDFWVLKYDSAGVFQWQKNYGGSGFDGAHSIQQTTEGGYIIAGYAYSTDFNISDNNGMYDFCIIKTDSSGNLQWQKSAGSSNIDWARAISLDGPEGYIVSGYTQGNDSDVVFNHSGVHDFWLTRLDQNGAIVWEKSLGGLDLDISSAVIRTADGGYMVGGYSKSNDGDASLNQGGWDYWMVKLANPDAIDETVNETIIRVYPNPSNTVTHFDFNSTEADAIVIYDMRGREINRLKIVNQHSILNSDLMAAGVYTYTVLGKEGDLMARGKFAVTE